MLYVYSLWQDLSIVTIVFDFLTLTLKFDIIFKNFKIGHILWVVSDRAYIFHVYSLWQDLFINNLIFDLLTLTLKFDLLFKTNIGHIFWMVGGRAFVFLTCVPCDMTFFIGILKFDILTWGFDEDGLFWSLPGTGEFVFHNISRFFCYIHTDTGFVFTFYNLLKGKVGTFMVSGYRLLLLYIKSVNI
jgi:hypothetical protein